MPLKYDKMFELLKAHGYNTTRIRKENILGQRTLTAIKNGTGGIDYRTIEKLCGLFNCQPNDIMEYIPGPATPKSVNIFPLVPISVPVPLDPKRKMIDEEWRAIEHFMTSIDDRIILNAIFCKVRTGKNWSSLPKSSVSYEVARSKFYEWYDNGLLKSVCETLRLSDEYGKMATLRMSESD